MQPLRIIQTVYVLLFVMLGAMLGRWMLKQSALRWTAAVVLLGGVMVPLERQTFPHSDRLELPWQQPRNEWEQAFLWIRQNTPRDASFALDSDYVTQPGEDVQTFRSIAERSSLPDYSKDGGEASITPELTAAWVAGESAQRGLSVATDAERIRRLRAEGVDWVVLTAEAVTGLDCEYRNAAAKVCRLP
jgi:hypothetical protein